MENPFKQQSVKVIGRKPHTKRRRELYNVLGKYSIFPTKMHSGQGVFFPIICESDLENMLKDELRQYAMEKGFEIKVSIEYSTMKTVVVKEIDSVVDEFEEEEIKESIERLKDWAKVADLFRFGTTSKMVKIQSSSAAMANKAIKEGIIILNQRIPPRRIEKEIFVKLMPCNNCYNYKHETKNCTQEKQMMCAFCGESGHRQSDCKNTLPKCINCGEAHRTLAAQCKIHKDLIRKRRKEIRQRSLSRSCSQVRIDNHTTSGVTYAATAGNGGPSQGQGQAVLSCEPEMKELTSMERRMVTKLKVIQHNILKWSFQHRNELTNLYMQTNPNVILLNSTGIKESERIKILNYNVYQKDKYNENNAGVAIAIKRDLIHQILDDFEEGVLAVKTDTTKEPMIVSMAYRPPRVVDFPLADVLKLVRKNMPVYILAKLNARNRIVGPQ